MCYIIIITYTLVSSLSPSTTIENSACKALDKKITVVIVDTVEKKTIHLENYTAVLD